MAKILHVFCIGTADTKLEELRFLADVLRSRLATFSNDSPTFKVLGYVDLPAFAPVTF